MSSEQEQKKSVLVTGAASRIGFGYEIVHRFSQDPKYNPIYATDKEPTIHEVYTRENHPRVVPLELDVRAPEQIVGVIEYILSEAGSVDVLINNAGVIYAGRPSTFWDEERNPTPEQLDLWRTNFIGPLLLIDAVIHEMRTRKSGTVVNITSTSMYNRSPFRSAYADSKALLVELTSTIAKREKPNNIHVVNVQPGMHKTAIDHGIWTAGNDALEMAAAQKLYDWWRRNFGGHPRDVAEVVYRIAEGEIKGHTVFVGLDAKFVAFMHRWNPYWDEIFRLGFNTVFQPIKFSIAISRKLKDRGTLIQR